MSVKYLSDEKGQVTAVRVPINKWELIKTKYPDVDDINAKLPRWHEELIDARLDAIANNLEKIRPISELMDELNK